MHRTSYSLLVVFLLTIGLNAQNIANKNKPQDTPSLLDKTQAYTGFLILITIQKRTPYT